jgi:DNA-directed RNA polymerase specialized sigma24 family protein
MDNKLVHHLLWERMRTGDRDAFFDLYKALYYELVNFGIRVCGDAETSGEATDQVFITIWQKREQLDRVDNVPAYLRTFLKRKILRMLERKRKISDALQNAGAEGEWMEMSYEEFIVKVQTDELVRYKIKKRIGETHLQAKTTDPSKIL